MREALRAAIHAVRERGLAAEEYEAARDHVIRRVRAMLEAAAAKAAA